MTAVVVTVAWIVCGVLVYGIAFGHAQGEQEVGYAEMNYRSDSGVAALFSLFGPIALVVMFFLTGFAQHGLKWK